MNYKIVKYAPEFKSEWDTFLASAANSHFFFKRDFLDYHKDKFNDHSLMFYDAKDSLVAVLAGNSDDKVFNSHAGLSFGGLIKRKNFRQSNTILLFNDLREYLILNGFYELNYKALPHIYHEAIGSEDLYALFVLGSTISRRDVSSTIRLDNQLPYSKGRKWLINKAKKAELSVTQISDLTLFWENLEHTLSAHETKPVHSLCQISFLKEKFPENIKVFAAYKGDIQMAGAVLFNNGKVSHAQYLFNTEQGRDHGALDLLIDHILKFEMNGFAYFDFGISTTDGGRVLNEGLISQKENFGARATCNEHHSLTLKVRA